MPSTTRTPLELAKVRRRARALRRARDAYKTALLEARAFGYSDAEIGRAAGISRQAVNQQLRPDEEEPCQP